MNFQVVGKIEQERTFATGSGIREIARLVKVYGKGRWRKIYEVLPDKDAEKIEHVRVIDESGDDYLYPASCFIDADLSKETQDAVSKTA